MTTAFVTDSDLLSATSSVSIPFYYVYLPRGEKISANFVYNYYTRDEGVSESTSLDAIDADSDQYDFVAENWENGVYPRQINITFSSPASYPNDTLADGVIQTASSEGKIVFEDAPFDSIFSGIIVHDTSVDEKIYNTLSSITGSSTSRRSVKNFLDISRLQSEGYRFSRAQTRQEIVEAYESETKSLNLAISLNDLFISDILKTSTIWQNSAFADEFAAAYEESINTQNQARASTVDPFQITENEIDISIDSIYSTFVRSDLSDLSNLEAFSARTESQFFTAKVGYLIEKYGEQLDGTTLRYPDIIISDPTLSNYTDPNVRYGGVYKYRVRTIYRTALVGVDESDYSSFEGFDLSVVLIASLGEYTTVQCIENIPPLPPVDVTFQQTLSGLYIRWNFPINKQKDIKRFQIFRRQDISQPFELIREISFDQTILPYTTGENVPKSLIQKSSGPIKNFTDIDFIDVESDYIYAICCVDAHGFSSAFSEQYRVRFDMITGKLLVTRISTAGAPKPYPNVNILGDFFSDIIKDSGHGRIRLYFDPEYIDVTRRGRSLSLISSDTGYANYKLCLTEINLVKNQTLDITIGDDRIEADGIPVSLARFYTAS